jgi:nucleoside-diphosphate-sugar epimerase
VFHCVNAPYTDWSRAFPPLTGNILEAAASAGAKLVFGDNLYMYGSVDGPITEDLPCAATDRKGRTRALMANKLMEAHKAGKVPVAIGRAPDFYGPGVTQSVMGARVFRPALKGGAISLLGDPDTPHTYAFVDEFARGLITLSEREEAFGRIWHTPNARTLTTRQFLELVFAQTGNRVPIRVAPRLLLTVAALFNPMVRELKDILYQWEQPFIVDHSRFEQAFGSDTTTHRNAIRQTLEWYRAH